MNVYIHFHAGRHFSSKDFRTWGGTVRVLWRLARLPAPSTKRERTQELNAVIDEVAARLGNTRAVCRKCYAHPDIVAAWEDGSLPDQVAEIGSKPLRKGLDKEESLTLRWLERHARD